MKIKYTMPARLLLLCSLAWLWFTLINHLRVEWSVNPQYAYGWAVPFLCLYLLWRNAEMLKVEMGTTGPQDHETTGLRDYGTTGPRDYGTTEPGGQEAKGFRGKAEMLKAETLKSSGLEAEGGEGKAETLKTSTHKAEVRGPRSVVSSPVVSGPGFSFSAFQLFSFFLLSFLYLPTRLVQEANPEWRLVSWALAFEVIGLTLLLLKITEDGGQKMEDGPRTTDHRPETTDHGPRTTSPISRFTFHVSRITHHASRFSFSASVFPILFFLVAVPWPTFIEGPLVQGLMRANVGATIELLALTGVPAIQHGNVIEIANGVVGIDDACSGIRSIQAALMLSLFFGEVYRLAVRRRLMLVVLGFLLAFAFNVGRTLLLTQVAAAKGIGAVSTWHDPAGVTILVACFLCLWLIAKGLRGKAEMLKSSVQRTEDRGQRAEVSGSLGKMGKAESREQKSEPVFARFQYVSFSAFQLFSIFLTFWLILVEAGTALWYRSRDLRLPAPTRWHVLLPTNNPTLRVLGLPAETRELLRYNEGLNVKWNEDDGTVWQLVWFEWNPGRAAGHLAKQHTPEACLPAMGLKLDPLPGVKVFRPAGVSLPFRSFRIGQDEREGYVFYCRRGDRGDNATELDGESTRWQRLRSVLTGKGNQGMRVIELAVWGPADPTSAEAALARELEKLIRVEK
jgi:exosortase/archaeosortase family protein